MVTDPSPRGFRAFSAPLPSAVVIYIAGSESRVGGALWLPDLPRGMANTGPYRCRDGPLVWNRGGLSLKGEGPPVGRGRSRDAPDVGCTSLAMKLFRFVCLDSSGGEEFIKRGLVEI